MMFSPQMLYEIVEIVARLYRNVDKEEAGQIPPLTKREAERTYGRENVKRWITAGRVRPYSVDNRKILFRYSECQLAKRADEIAKKWTDGRVDTQYYNERIGFIGNDEVGL